MDISPRKPTRRAADPVDDWLRNEGYFRKNSPNDPACLFKAVSEQIYMRQYDHVKVRKECVGYMRARKSLFEETVEIPFENYLAQMSCLTEWGGAREIMAMSMLYERDFIVYDAQKMIRRMATNNGYDKYIYLCQCAPKQYESIFERNVIATAAFCQSIVYQILYEDVFQMDGIGDTVQKMLHDKSTNIRHDKFFLRSNIDMRDQLKTELMDKLENEDKENDEKSSNTSIQEIKAPFPYRVAKALDPDIYRNTDFDIYHEIKREIRCASWTRWNGSELQVGGKCIVVIDSKGNDHDNKDNNSILMTEKDGNENFQKRSETTSNKESKMIGHIQEMSKNEGPVVVFIEELGEKRTVPYSSLKPLLCTSKKPSNVSIVSVRRNYNYDSNYKWSKKQWNSNYRKSKDSVRNIVFNGFDRLNNNDIKVDCEDTKKEKLDNYRWNKNSEYNHKKNPTAVLKNLTSIDNYSPKKNNSIEVRPVSIVHDNPNQQLKSAGEQRKEFEKKQQAPTPPPPNYNNNNVSQVDMNENMKSLSIKSENENGNNGSTSARSTPAPQQNEIQQNVSHPVAINGPSMYQGNPGMVCVSPDGNLYSEIPYYGGYMAEPQLSPGSNVPGHEHGTLRPVNLAANPSQDINGGDLPLSDLITLRFFYNLGIESFRYGHMWQPSSGPMTYAPGFIPQGNIVQILPSGDFHPIQVSPQQQQQQLPQHQASISPPNNGRENRHHNYQQNRRRGDQNFHPGPRNTNNYGNQKNMYVRKNDPQDSGYQRDREEGQKSYDHQKLKGNYGNPEGNKDPSLANREPRRNNGEGGRGGGRGGVGGRFKKDNDGRNRSYERQYQQDYQPKQNVNYQGNIYNRSNESQPFRPKSEGIHQPPPQIQTQPQSQTSPQTSTTVVQTSAQQFHPTYGPPPSYTNIQFIPNEMENFYPSNGNFYPVPILAPHSDMPEGNPGTYVCTGPENFQPPMSPMYSPYIYPPPQIYPGNSPPIQENWYQVPGNQQLQQQQPPPAFVSYGQVPIPQQPPNVNRPSTSG